jgi:hypothetical protein
MDAVRQQRAPRSNAEAEHLALVADRLEEVATQLRTIDPGLALRIQKEVVKLRRAVRHRDAQAKRHGREAHARMERQQEQLERLWGRPAGQAETTPTPPVRVVREWWEEE